MTESELMKRIQILASHNDCRLFRNNTGQAWSGRLFRPTREQTVAVSPRDVVLYSARPISFGLAVGSGDLIGWHQRTVTADDVGKTIALFLSVETKNKRGVITNAQEAWANIVNAMGGIGVVARSEQDLIEALKTKGPGFTLSP